MSVSAEDAARRAEVLSAGLKRAGLRLTRQRLEIVNEIVGSDAHPDVETVYHRVRERDPGVSLDTVYRTVSTLVEHGLIDRVTSTSGAARYDGNPFPHHHFVCTRCGAIYDIEGPGALPASGSPVPPELGDVETVQVEYRGICTTCRRADAGR